MTKLKNYILMAYLLLCPIAYNVAQSNMRDFQEKFWQIAAMCLVVLFCNNIWMSLFFFWNIILFVFAGGQVGWNYTINIFLGIMLFTVMRRYFKYYRAELALKPVIWIGLASLFWVGLQYAHIDPLFKMVEMPHTIGQIPVPVDKVGLFGLKAINGLFAAFVIPIAYIFNPLFSLLFFIPVALSQSSSAMVAAGAAFIFCLFYINRKVSLFVIPIVLVGMFSYVVFFDFPAQSHMFKNRLGIWHAGVRYALQNPLGHGPDSWRNTNKLKKFIFVGGEDNKPAIAYHVKGDTYQFKYYSPDSTTGGENPKEPIGSFHFWDNAHNLYVQLLIEYGFIGIFLVFALMREIFVRFKYSIKSKELVFITATIIAFLVSSVGQFPFFLARVGFLFPIILGAFFSLTDEKGRRTTLYS